MQRKYIKWGKTELPKYPLNAVRRWGVNKIAFEEIKKGLERYIQEMGKQKVHAHWINGSVDFICSECQEHSHRREDVCLNCGARMMVTSPFDGTEDD